MSHEHTNPKNLSRSQQIFRDAPEELRLLLKEIIEKERQVMHKKTKTNIYLDLYGAVKTFIR